MVHLPPIATVMAPRSDASCWCISARSCIADISLGGQDLLDRTGDRSLETKRRETLKRCCFSSLAVCADHARDRRETPYALALCRAPLRSGAIPRYRVHPDMA
jgi:hypothetical protein